MPKKMRLPGYPVLCCIALAACTGGSSSVVVKNRDNHTVTLSYLAGSASANQIAFVGSANCPSGKASIVSMGERDTSAHGHIGDWETATLRCID